MAWCYPGLNTRGQKFIRCFYVQKSQLVPEERLSSQYIHRYSRKRYPWNDLGSNGTATYCLRFSYILCHRLILRAVWSLPNKRRLLPMTKYKTLIVVAYFLMTINNNIGIITWNNCMFTSQRSTRFCCRMRNFGYRVSLQLLLTFCLTNNVWTMNFLKSLCKGLIIAFGVWISV